MEEGRKSINSTDKSTSKPSKPSKPPQRLRLDLSKKTEILNYLAKGKKQSGAVRHFGISASTICDIFKQRFKILDLTRRCHDGKSMTIINRSPFQVIDDPLVRWINDARKKNIPLDKFLVREKAREIAKGLGSKNFPASVGWLCRFKKR